MAQALLSRMLKPRSTLPEPDIAADGLAGIMAKSASVAGLTHLEAQMEAQSRKARLTTPAEFIKTLPENALVLTIECHVEAQIGMIGLDPEIITIINELLTGEIGREPAAPRRPPTAVDIALCRPFLDGIMAEFNNLLQTLREGRPTETYHTADRLKDPSPHQFSEVPYTALTLELSFGQSLRKGHISCLIPTANTDFDSQHLPQNTDDSTFNDTLTRVLENAPVILDVVLYRKQMPIGKILQIKPGDMLEIPARALENLSVESKKGAVRKSLMQARLGEYQEMRAAKVTRIGALKEQIDNAKLLLSEQEIQESPPAAQG
ncbi:MAG: FliM/FliN family flagellar motor switch protein [Rhodobacteraceae bacterium]|nr:FliM/FliN family flagellar motor switch protein [Paracoccaceae bacterium]